MTKPTITHLPLAAGERVREGLLVGVRGDGVAVSMSCFDCGRPWDDEEAARDCFSDLHRAAFEHLQKPEELAVYEIAPEKREGEG